MSDSMNNAKKNIMVIATGGTIAGAGEQGKDIGYKSGSIKAQALIDAIPELNDVANIRVEQFCNINSDDITSEIWISLALRIKELSKQEDVDGFVIMHGTDTMEETAFFLSLVLGADASGVAKPVVLTGSMRPATAAEPDGPANLLFAVKCAVEQSLRRPERAEGAAGSVITVYVAFAGKLMNARTLQKIHANDLDAFAEVDGSPAACHPGLSSRLQCHPGLSSRTPFRDHLLALAFDISALHSLPKVSVLYFNADADAELVRFAAERSAGLVIAGAGAGEFSQAWAKSIADVIAQSNVPVVVSSRINRGCIVPEQLLVPGTIAAYGLPPAKAAVLLRLALTVTNNVAEIQKFFNE